MIAGANGNDEAGCSCGDNEVGGGDGDVATDALGMGGGVDGAAGGLGVSLLGVISSSSSSWSSSCFIVFVGSMSFIISPRPLLSRRSSE